jgi:hypothetical protein
MKQSRPSGEDLVHSFFGGVKVAEHADESCIDLFRIH